MTEDKVILVDLNDNPIGEMDKSEVHRTGVLHRAVSVLVFNSDGDFLLQQRALTKYHSPGLWTNTCCSHPRPGESSPAAAHRRLKEEMGIECQLNKAFSFLYRAEFENGLTENEFDTVYIGNYNRDPVINSEEASGFQWVSRAGIYADVELYPESYTAWFRIILSKLKSDYSSLLKR
jgi:isopentenyl-diphosphate Delta-isomerase